MTRSRALIIPDAEPSKLVAIMAPLLGVHIEFVADSFVNIPGVLSMTSGWRLTAHEVLGSEVARLLRDSGVFDNTLEELKRIVFARYRFKIQRVAQIWPWLRYNQTKKLGIFISDAELLELCKREPLFREFRFRKAVGLHWKSMWLVIRMLLRRWWREVRQDVREASATAELQPYVPARSTVMLVLHTGLTYGSLYDWGFWVKSEEENSPLSRNSIALATYDSRCPKRIDGRQVQQLGSILRLWGRNSYSSSFFDFLRSLLKVPQWKYAPSFWALSLHQTRSRGFAQQLQEQFSSVRLAILSYDILTPSWVVEGCHRANVHTVAAQERPNSSCSPWAGVSIDTYLSAGPYFAAIDRIKPTNLIGEIKVLGQYRSDLIIGKGDGAFADKSLKTVLVLPFHLDHGSKTLFDVTSVRYARHFIIEILKIAQHFSHLSFVIRSKNDEIHASPAMADLFARMPSNLVFDQDWSVHAAYRIARTSALVIGKATSLMDEALACGVPAIFVDYGPWGVTEYREALNYLPEELWAQSHDDLVQKIEWTLVGDGATFREWWEPHRLRIYGDMSDGRVRERARGVALHLLDGQLARFPLR
jgi:hypothetical protein